jgi:hypothetical protein
MDKIRYRFAANDKNLLWRRFKTIISDWSDEIENPGVKWCLRDERLHNICDELVTEFNSIVYDEDNTGCANFEFGPQLKLNVDFSVLELVDRHSEDELSECKVEVTFDFHDLSHEITYRLTKEMNVKLKKVKAGYM